MDRDWCGIRTGNISESGHCPQIPERWLAEEGSSADRCLSPAVMLLPYHQFCLSSLSFKYICVSFSITPLSLLIIPKAATVQFCRHPHLQLLDITERQENMGEWQVLSILPMQPTHLQHPGSSGFPALVTIIFWPLPIFLQYKKP